MRGLSAWQDGKREAKVGRRKISTSNSRLLTFSFAGGDLKAADEGGRLTCGVCSEDRLDDVGGQVVSQAITAVGLWSDVRLWVRDRSEPVSVCVRLLPLAQNRESWLRRVSELTRKAADIPTSCLLLLDTE